MSNRFFLPLILLLPLCAACVQPIRQLTSFRDPAYRDSTYRRIVVFAEDADLQWRYDLESQLAEVLRQWKVDAQASHAVLIPTRTWNDSNRAVLLAGNGFDAYLHLVVNTVDTWESTVPGRTSTEVQKKTTNKGAQDDKATSVYTETVKTQTNDAYTIRNTRLRYVIRLVDMAAGDTVWMGLNSINGYSKSELPRFCEEITSQLLRDTVLLADSTLP